MTRPESVRQAIWDTLTPEAQACFVAVIGRLERRIADIEARPNEPPIHQVAELPVVYEHRRYRLRCPGCGGTTCGVLPTGVPAGAPGPLLRATLVPLAGAYRLGKLQVQQPAHDSRIAAGLIARLERQLAAAELTWCQGYWGVNGYQEGIEIPVETASNTRPESGPLFHSLPGADSPAHSEIRRCP